MRLFWDLNKEDREHHLQVANQLSPGSVYFFDPPVWAVPHERQLKGSPDKDVPILFDYGEFINFRRPPSLFRDCLFSVQEAQVNQKQPTGQSEFTVSLLFTREAPAPRP